MREKNIKLRQEIDRIAYRKFSALPYKDVFLKDIAEEAGIKKSLLQYYHPQKHSLMAEMMEELLWHSFNYVDGIVEKDENIHVKLAVYTSIFWMSCDIDEGFGMFLFNAFNAQDVYDHVMEEIHMKNAVQIDKMRCMRLPSSKKLQKSYAAGAIMIGDAANAAECAFDYGIPSAMYGGQIAANVIKGCIDKGDFSEEAMSAYQPLAEEALNDGLVQNDFFRNVLLAKKDVMTDYVHWAEKQPGYPNISFQGTAMKYIMEVLGYNFTVSDKQISQ